MSGQVMKSNDLEKAINHLMSISKAQGTQIQQGKQKRPTHPDPTEQYYDDPDKEKWEDDVDENDGDYKHLEQLESTSSVGTNSDGDSEHDDMYDPHFAGGKAKKPKGSVAKGMDEEEYDDEDDDMPKKKMKKKMKKSIAKSFRQDVEANATTSQGIEVSEFLAEMTDILHKSLGHMETKYEDVRKSEQLRQEKQDRYTLEMAKVIKSLHSLITSQSERIATVEGEPTAPKTKTRVLEKSFQSATPGAEVRPEGLPEGAVSQHEKRDILSKLEKGVMEGKVNVSDVYSFEHVNNMSEAAQAYVNSLN